VFGDTKLNNNHYNIIQNSYKIGVEEKMKIKSLLIIFVLVMLISGCGEGVVNIDDGTYNPKIVMHGILIPGYYAEVHFARNFPLKTSVRLDETVLADAQAKIIDESGAEFNLTLNRNTGHYQSHELIPEYGKTYTLEVSATIDGQPLFARSTTTVPQAGLEIIEEKSVLDSMTYRQRDENDNIIDFELTINRSDSTDFYAASVFALNADTTTFIYDNPFGDPDAADVQDDLYDFQQNYTWIQDTPLGPGESIIPLFYFFTWFYGDYRVIVYAGDRNLKEFVISNDMVQEIDGNFHEPAFHIEGDGIGVFGSAVTDTAFFYVKRE
jgi:hypothetical protein